MKHLVKVELGFEMFDRGEQLIVTEDFMERYDKYLTDLGPVEGAVEDQSADEVVELDQYEGDEDEDDVDGEGGDLPSEG